jgi:hypothetical protein
MVSRAATEGCSDNFSNSGVNVVPLTNLDALQSFVDEIAAASPKTKVIVPKYQAISHENRWKLNDDEFDDADRRTVNLADLRPRRFAPKSRAIRKPSLGVCGNHVLSAQREATATISACFPLC